MSAQAAILTFCLAFLTATAGEKAPEPSGDIVEIEMRVPMGMNENDFRPYIDLKPGMPFSRDAVDNDLKRLKLTEKFKDVQAQVLEVSMPDGKKGVKVVFVLVSKTLIREIRMEGNHALGKGDILSAMDLMEGIEFRGSRDELDSWSRAIKDAYKDEGFPRAEASFKAEKIETGIRLIISISENYPIRVATIDFQGDPFYDVDLLRDSIPLKAGKTLRRPLIDDSVQALKKIYRDAGFWGATVESPSVTMMESEMDARLVFTANAGERYHVSFKGNKHFKALEKFIDIEGGVSIDYWAEQIEGYYKANGFPYVRVNPSMSEKGRDKEVLFSVEEGDMIRLEEISFQGNRSVSSKELLDQMATRTWSVLGIFSDFFSRERVNGIYTEERLRDDLKAVLSLYQRKGFLSAKIEDVRLDVNKENKRMAITVFIDEGDRTMLEAVELKGVQSVPEDELRKIIPLKSGTPLDLFAVDQGNITILKYYRAKGYFFAKTSADVEFEKNGNARVAYSIIEGPRLTVGKIIVQGTDKTKDYVVRREVTVKPGDPYTQDALMESRQRLTRLGYFDRVSISPVERGSIRDILVSIKEGNTAHVSVGAGYGNVDGIRGFIEFAENNITGRGRAAAIRMEGAEDIVRYSKGGETFTESVNEEKVTLGYREPYFFRSKIRARADLIHQYQNRRFVHFSIRKNSALWGFEHDLSRHLKGILLHEFSIRKLMGEYPKGETELLQLGIVTLAAIHDIRDDPFNPRRGHIWSLQVDDADTFMASKESFIKAIAKWGYYNPIFDSVIGSVVMRAGYGLPYGESTSIPIDRRFFTGGANSIRGFVEDTVGPKDPETGNPVGGNMLLNLTLEARAPLWGFLGLALFTDWGNVWEDPAHFELNRFADVRESAGLGLRYLTPIGPLRIDLGFKLDRKGDEHLLGFHFFIGNVF